MITAQTLFRAEVWDKPKAAGGVRLAILANLLRLQGTAQLTGDSSLEGSIALQDAAVSSLLQHRILRVDDGTLYDEWVIATVKKSSVAGTVDFTCDPLTMFLGSRALVAQTDAVGAVRFNFDLVGLKPSDILTAYVLPALVASGVTWVAVGTIDQDTSTDLTFDWDTPLGVVKALAAARGLEFQLRRNGDTGYLIDLVTAIGSAAAVVDVRYAKNLLSHEQQGTTDQQATRVYPRGMAEEGFRATMARAVWEVGGVGGAVIGLVDPAGGDGPIMYDNQLVGKYLRKPDGTLVAVIASSSTAQSVTLSSGAGIVVGDLVQFRLDNTGADLTYLSNPTEEEGTAGIVVAALDAPDIPGTNNVIPNPATRDWAAGLPTGWTKVGNPTITQQVAAPYVKTAGKSAHVVATAAEQGIQSPSGPVVMLGASPYISGFATFWVVSGTVRVELVLDYAGGQVVIPYAPQYATSNELGKFVDLGVEAFNGFDPNLITEAAVRVVAHGGAAEFYVDSAQATESSAFKPFVEGSGGTQLWQRANERLRLYSSLFMTEAIDAVDLYRLDGTRYVESRIELGATIRVTDPVLGAAYSTRIISFTRNYLVEGEASVQLSTRPEDLSGALAKAARPARLASGTTSVVSTTDVDINLNDMRVDDATTPGSRIYRYTAGSLVDRVLVYDTTLDDPVDPDAMWPLDGDTPNRILTPDPVTRYITYTAVKPPRGTERFIQFDPRTASLQSGIIRRVVLEPVGAAFGASISVVVANDKASLTIPITGGTGDFPLAVVVYQDGVAILTTSVLTSTTLNSGTDAVLGNIQLPLTQLVRWAIKLTNVAGEVVWGDGASADRDPVAGGTVSAIDFKAAPSISVEYDDDTDSVVITIPGGLTKTWAGLSGSGTKTYTVGDAVDVGSPEAAMAPGDVRTGYRADVVGGGVTKTLWRGELHGAPSNTVGPTLTVTPTPGDTSYSLLWAVGGSTVATLSIDGGSFSTPGTSPIVVSRHATHDKVYTFKGTLNGQTVTDSVTIPSLESGTTTPDLQVNPGTPGTTTQPYTVTATDPSGTAGTPTITVTPVGCTMVIAGVTYSTAQTVTSGTVVTVNRPVSTIDTQAHIRFRASIAGQGAEEIDRTVPAILNVGPSLTVTPTPGATPTADYSVVYTATGTVTYSVDGGSFTTPGASPIVVARHATLDKTLTFKAILDGQTVTDSVTIPSLEKDTVTPDLQVAVGFPGAATQPYTVTATNPAGGTAPTITVTPVNTTMVIGGVTYSTAQTVSTGTVVTADRPASTTAGQAHIIFQASISGGGGEAIDRTVPAQLNLGPSLEVTPTPGATQYSIAYTASGTVTRSIDGGSFVTPGATPEVVARHATVDKTYIYKCALDGQTVSVTVVIPSLEKDTITPSLHADAGTPTATQQPYTITGTNPSGGTAPTITVTPVNTTMVIGGVTYSTVQTISTGTVVTVNRPSSTTTTQAHLLVSASISGGGTADINRSVPAQLNVGPSLTVTGTPGPTSWGIAYSGSGTITYSVDGGSFTTPPASPLTITLDGNAHVYMFKAVLDGQTITTPIVIPPAPPTTAAGIVSITPSSVYAPCDGGGSVDITFTTTGLTGTESFDIIITPLTGIYASGAYVRTTFNATSPQTCSAVLCPGENYRVFIRVRIGSDTMSTAFQDFTA